MRRHLHLTLLVGLGAALVVPAGVAAQVPTTKQPIIFRQIHIAPFGEIRLGERFRQAPALGVPIRDRLFRLADPGGKPGQYGDTEMILVELDSGDNVRALYFAYRSGGESFKERTREYTTALGPPTSIRYDSAGAAIVRQTWQDAATTFDLLQITDSSGTRVASALRDRLTPKPASHGS